MIPRPGYNCIPRCFIDAYSSQESCEIIVYTVQYRSQLLYLRRINENIVAIKIRGREILSGINGSAVVRLLRGIEST